MRPAFVNHHQTPSVQNFKIVDPNVVGGSAPYYSFGGNVDDYHMCRDPRDTVNIQCEEVDLPGPQIDNSSANHISVISSNRGPAMAQDSINTFLDDYYEVFQKNMKERVSKCEPSNLIYVNTCDVTHPPPTHNPDAHGVQYDAHLVNRRTKHRHFLPSFDGEFSGIRPRVEGNYASPPPSFNPRVPPPMFHRSNHGVGENIRLPPLHIPPPPLPVPPPLQHKMQPPLPPSPPPQPPPLPPSDKTEEMEFSYVNKPRRKSQSSLQDSANISSKHNVFSPPSTSGRKCRQSESLSRTTVVEPSKLDLDSRIRLLLNDGPLGHLVPKRKTSSISRKHSHRHELKNPKPSPPSSHNTPLFEEHPDEPLSPPPSPFRSRAIYLKWHSLWVQRTLNTKKNFMERTSEPRPHKEKTQLIRTDKHSIGKKGYDVKKKLQQVLQQQQQQQQQQKGEISWSNAALKRLESPQRLQDPDSTVDCGVGNVTGSHTQEVVVCDSSVSPAGADGLTTTVQSVVQTVVGELTRDLKQELSNKLLDHMFGKIFANWGEMKSRGFPT